MPRKPSSSLECATVDFKRGIEAWKQKDYATALPVFRELAKRGDRNGQYWLAIMYDKGQGVPQDREQATYWFTKVAEQGSSVNQMRLGARFLHMEDYERAVYWLTKASEQGQPYAQVKLAKLYHEGKKIARDYKQAIY
jgi:TPR repeat protein